MLPQLPSFENSLRSWLCSLVVCVFLAQASATIGGTVYISVPECGIDGNAEVLRIEPCPAIKPGTGHVIIGKFIHHSARVISVHVSGEPKPIGTTDNHLFWSETQQDFVPAGQLSIGETLLTKTGTATVTAIQPRGPPETVYNLEVHGHHVYQVGSQCLLVHNGGAKIVICNDFVTQIGGVDINAPRGSGHYIVFNKTHSPSLPPIGTRRGAGPNGGDIQSHHILQNEWAKHNLPGYEGNLAPTISIETGKAARLGTPTDAPHTIINQQQINRRNARLQAGGKQNKWNSTLDQELANSVSDLQLGGFSKSEISQSMDSVYKMLDKLGVSGYTKPTF